MPTTIVKNIWKKIWGFITYNTDVNTYIIIILVVAGIYLYTNFIIKRTEEKTIGINPAYKGFQIETAQDMAKAAKLGYKQIVLEDEKGDIRIMAMDIYKLPVEEKKSRIKFASSIDFQGMDVGLAYEALKMYGFNVDAPIVQTRSAGIGVSKDIISDLSFGGGAFFPYDSKDVEDLKERTMIKGYLTWRF